MHVWSFGSLESIILIFWSIRFKIINEACSTGSSDLSLWSASIAITKDDLRFVSLAVVSNRFGVFWSRWDRQLDTWLTIVEFEPNESVVRICSDSKLSTWASRLSFDSTVVRGEELVAFLFLQDSFMSEILVFLRLRSFFDVISSVCFENAILNEFCGRNCYYNNIFMIKHWIHWFGHGLPMI